MILLLPAALLVTGAAMAADGHGAPVVPCAVDASAPVVAWHPGAAEARTWTACATVEAASQPVMATVTDDGESRTFAALDDLVGLHVAGSYGFGRVGVGADLPFWLASTSDGESNPPVVGDARLYVPISLVQAKGPGAVGLDAVAELTAPTGDAASLLGAGPGAGAHLVLGASGERLGGDVDLGVGYSSGEPLTGLDTRLWTRLAVSGQWFVVPRLAVGAEAWWQVSPLAGSAFWPASPGEALLRIGVDLGRGLSVTAAGGTAITPGAGAAEGRAYVRLGWAGGAAKASSVPDASAKAALPPGPFDVLISVRDEGGKPVDAQLSWEGPEAPGAAPCGADGEGRATLAPGAFRLTVSAAGFGTQRRDVILDPDRFHAERVEVVLLPDAGSGAVRLAVEDAEGRKVDGATIAVDGRPVGTTSTGGSVEIGGLAAGDHALAVSQPDFREHRPVTVAVPQTDAAVATITLERPPGSVQVITRGPAGPVSDARVRFAGPEDLPAQNIGADGERTFTLLPGHWILLASAESLGTQEREFEVEAGKTALVVIDVRMAPTEAGSSRLIVRVVDPTGRPVDGAEVLVDGKSAGRTSNEGSISLADLRAGERSVVAHADRFRDSSSRTVSLGEGTREITLPLAWRPGQLHLLVRGVEGGIVDARVRFSGPSEVPAADLGADGEAWFSLDPGTWTLAISSASYGLQQRDVEVRPDDVALVDIDASLLSADGEAVLALRVVDKKGTPIGGAAVLVDEHAVGTTATAGTVEISGLRKGKHTIMVNADGMKPRTQPVTLGAGTTKVEARLDASARGVDVFAKAPSGPATDALVRGYGPEVLAPTPVAADGHRPLSLEPAPWTLVAVSEQFGIAQRDIDVKPGASPISVELGLHPPATETGSLLVEVVDPAGNPVAGSSLVVDGASQSLGPNGVTVLADRRPGTLKLAASAPGYRARPAESVSLVRGVQTLRLRLEWLPRPVSVQVTDAGGAPVDAEVRVIGPGRGAPTRSGGDAAHFELLPGTWQILASAKGFGPWRSEVEVGAGVAPVVVVAALAAEKVEVTRTSVVIREQVQFAFDKADIEPGSHPLLAQVASTLLLHPEIPRIEVQGHTDTRGTEVYNQDLSQRRAEAVRAYLVGQGVEPGRIEARGYGATRPLGDNNSESGRAKNRRVQFEIVSGNSEGTQASPP